MGKEEIKGWSKKEVRTQKAVEDGPIVRKNVSKRRII